MPYSLCFDSINTIFVHAGLVPGIPLEDQKLRDLCTMRNVIVLLDESKTINNNNGIETNWIATHRIDEGYPWANVYSDSNDVDAPHVFFGHGRQIQFVVFVIVLIIYNCIYYHNYQLYFFFIILH